MRRDRREFHERLVEILGSRNVYFEPPESIKMVYPCIVYHRSPDEVVKADNRNYLIHTPYAVTYIHFSPDVDDIYDALENLDYSRHSRTYNSDGLRHDTFDIYY